MALQHHELELWLRDVERLRLFVQAGMAEREMQSVSLKKAELACRRLELEAREFAERATRAESERDAMCHEAAMAKLETEGAVNTRAQIESELARVQRALALAGKGSSEGGIRTWTRSGSTSCSSGGLQESRRREWPVGR